MAHWLKNVLIHPLIVGGDARVFPAPMPPDDDDVLPVAFPVRRRDALRASFEKEHDGAPRKPKGIP
jgi:hypothetical protein